MARSSSSGPKISHIILPIWREHIPLPAFPALSHLCTLNISGAPNGSRHDVGRCQSGPDFSTRLAERSEAPNRPSNPLLRFLRYLLFNLKPQNPEIVIFHNHLATRWFHSTPRENCNNHRPFSPFPEIPVFSYLYTLSIPSASAAHSHSSSHPVVSPSELPSHVTISYFSYFSYFPSRPSCPAQLHLAFPVFSYLRPLTI